MYHTNAAYKQKVTELPQDYRMEIEVIYDAQVEDLLETLQCEDSASLETEAGEAFEHSVQSAERITIPPEDIFEAGFSESVFLNTFCVGSSVRANFWVRIFNENGKYRNDALATAEIRPWVTLYDDAGKAVDTVPVGVFYVDQITVQNNDLRLDCFDKMQFMETLFIPQETETSLYAIMKRLAATVRADFVTTLQKLVTNSAGRSIISNTVNDSIFKGYSNKQVIECIAEVCGSFAIFNPDGDLELRWFKKADVELRGDWANAALELNGNTFSLDGNVVQVTGVRVVNEDTELAKAGTDDYLLTINENPIAAVMPALAANAVLYRMKGMKYIPCKWCRIGGDPSLQLGDILTVIDNKTEYNEADYDSYDKYPLYMTARSWQFNCGGFSDTYTSAGNAETDLNRDRGMTVSKRISQLAKRVTETEKNITEGMTDYEAALLMFNEKMFNAAGLYKTVVEKDNGGIIMYFHDEVELESSQVIQMFSASGFAWTTDGWNDGDPLWNYGFTDAGDAILNTINAYIVSADLIKTGLLQSQNGASWINMDDGTFCFRAVKDMSLNIDTMEPIYTFEKVLELAGKELNVYGALRNLNFPEYSSQIGPSQKEQGGAFSCSYNNETFFQISKVNNSCYLEGLFGEKSATVLLSENYVGLDYTHFDDNGYVRGGRLSLDDEFYVRTEQVWIETVKDTLCISSKSYPYVWFNYYKPKGLRTTGYRFGDGTEEGYGFLFAANFTVMSDRTLKTNISKIDSDNALTKVKLLKFYSYDTKDSGNHCNMGVMADEAPQDILYSDGKSVNLYDYISLTAKAVQELSAKVEQQEKEIAELKAAIAELKQ